ncbi:MAG: DUF1329 domain-containing protein [Myxococcota bacterium]|nr:DUF1329 domain-containing protein [Myxococcota bacterium]
MQLARPAILLLVAGAALAALEAGASPWEIPPEGSCDGGGALRGEPGVRDVPATPVAPGEVFDVTRIEALRDYFPAELWQHRDRFFHEGMRLEIGPCFRDYSPPEFFVRATESHRGTARLLENRGLEGHGGGLPFAPDTVAPEAADAGLRWAWNFAHRYQAAGFQGSFQITDLLGKIGRAEPFRGEIFRVLLARRTDRSEAIPYAGSKAWVAGGLFSEPFNAREYSWRQYRDVAHERVQRRTDDLHAWMPQLRRVRRIPSTQVEGLYMPTFSVGATPALGGGGQAASVGNVGQIQTKRSGFEGLEIRPLLYEWRFVGVHDVLAPINAVNAMYPVERARDFGPWGLSFASDRWDLRRALVLEASRTSVTEPSQAFRIVFYVDLQTLHPLFYLSYDRRNEPIDVGVFVGRWSEDRPNYPPWPDDPSRPVRVIDSVGAAFANLQMRGSWRRETWEMVSVPPDDGDLRPLLSVRNLTQRH